MATDSGALRFVPREEAVQALAAAIADRTHFIVSLPPSLIAECVLAARFAKLPSGWRVYFDNGMSTTLSVDTPKLVEAVELGAFMAPFGSLVGVATIPKTTPARRIREALGVSEEIPHDGSRDLLMIHEPRLAWQGFFYPMLLVEALDIVDPTVAMQIRANESGSQN